MRQFTAFLTAAALTVGGVCFAADPPAAPNDAGGVGTDTGTVRTETNTTEVRTTDNRGNNPAVAAPDADDIRKSIASITETAVTKGDFNKLTRRFVDADHERIEKFKASDNFAKLDGRIDQFRKDWKAKYNEDFNFPRQTKDVLNDQFAKIVQGEIGEARTASNKEMPSAEPQNVKGGTPQDLKKSGVNQPDANSTKIGGGETNREPGRNIATVIFPGFASMSAKVQPGQTPAVDAQMAAQKELAVPFIHELPDSWRVDVPDNIDGQKLYDSLLKHITMLDEARDSWPADKNEAYREATRHVMAALVETGM